MPRLLSLISADRATANAQSLAVWNADVIRESWTAESETVPAGASVADVFALIQKHAPVNHVQIFGAVPVPQAPRNPDGHGFRLGDCDGPYCSNGLSEWQPQADGTFNYSGWLKPAARSIGRIDTSGLPVDETAALDAVLARNHAYRTGAYQYGAGALIDNRLDYLGIIDAARLVAQYAAVVGAANVADVTRQYPDEAFCGTYKGLSALYGALFSGGDPYRQQDGFTGHEYYLANLSDICAGYVQMGGVRIFCSYGWEFKRWPLLRALIAGGSLWSLYDVWAQADLTGWNETTTIGETVRAAIHQAGMGTIDTLMGDGTLKRMAIAQQGPTMQDLTNLAQRVGNLETLPAQIAPLLGLPQQISGLNAQMAQLAAQGPPVASGGPSVGVSVVNGAFTLPSMPAAAYQYNPTVPGWQFVGAALVGTGSIWGVPAGSPSSQVAAVQGGSSLLQTLSGLTVGQAYAVKLSAVQRPGVYGGQTLAVLIDGVQAGTIKPGATWLPAFVSFTPSKPSHVLAIQGMATGDNTAFVTGVTVG